MSQAMGPCIVEQAIIIAVNPQNYTCTVTTTKSDRTIPDLPFCVPTLHSRDKRGGGLNFMPDVGDVVYIFTPQDDSGTFILGATYLKDDQAVRYNVAGRQEEQDSYKQLRPSLNPGDIALTTQDENFIYVRRGGVIQIGSTQLAQRLYIPIENLIRDYFQRYQAFSPIGEISWDHAKVTAENVDPAKEKEIPVLVKFSCREKIRDKKMSVEVRVGKLNSETLDASLNANLLQEGKTSKISTVKDVDDAETGLQVDPKKLELVDVELDAGDGDKEHLMATAMAWKGTGLKPDHDKHPGLLSVTITPEEEDAHAVKYTFQVDKKGNNFIRSEAHIHVETEDTFFVSAKNNIKLTTSEDSENKEEYLELKNKKHIKAVIKEAILELLDSGDINMTTEKGDIVIKSAKGAVTLEAKGVITLKSSKGVVIDAPELNIAKGGEGSFGVLANAAAWKTALADHTHMCPTPGGPAPCAPSEALSPVKGAPDTASTGSCKIKVG